ncbi:MAG: hypothetical protein LBO78_03220 [Rickettsiales bacterium]|jgi:hypothetical protein|nr:hypothetical protein [Rickettsiales bacterium]
MARFVNPMYIYHDKQKGRLKDASPLPRVDYRGTYIRIKNGILLPKTRATATIKNKEREQ